MKLVKNWKKAAAVWMAAVMLTAGAEPVMAHGHGGCHTSYSGSYCSYHGTTHNRKSSCVRYCAKHRTTHANGRVHH